MQNYILELKSDPIVNFYTEKAANSVDLDITKKLSHRISVSIDIETDYKIGLIVGNSGSGKTTLAKKLFGENVFKEKINENKCILEHFKQSISYEERVNFITSIGLGSVPCWIKPIKVLSNGQKARVEIIAKLARDKNPVVIDEFTSVVDRTVAKVMSNSIKKFCEKFNKKLILLSCHYDIIEWLNPCWILDLTENKYIDRRSLRQDFKRKEKIKFNIKECDSRSWKNFSKYHYLSDKIPYGKNYFFGLYLKEKQVGFICFSNYVPHADKAKKKILHFNRAVIHPDYTGFGLGRKFITITSEIMSKRNFQIYGKFANKAVHKLLKIDRNWEFMGTKKNLSWRSRATRSVFGTAGYRKNVLTYHYRFSQNS